MKVRLYFCVILLLLLPSSVIIKSTQTYYWIRFTDKNNINQPAPNEYSLPVAEEYLKKIQSLNIEIIGTSKWLNMALVRSTPRQVKTLRSLTFIKNLLPVIKSQSKLTEYNSREADHSSIREKQLGWFEYDIIKKMGLTGKGIRIAVFDGGFPGTDTHPGFQHLFNKNRIVATWNFPNNSQDVFRNNHHGTAVLSCITGQMNGQPTGLATDAEFLLARTELPGEPWREQLYWIQAAEWAEKNGANIICSALGYTYHHYFHENMDGSSPVAEAARVATSKGILVINSMGNDGDSKWKIVSTPADATEVLGVGGIDPETGLKASFSSFGPNTMGELKPNVVAPSTVVAATPTSWKIMYGTS
ncbi:MAG: S8 family serine peptidase, partial [Bacteroidales bacterium]|nr:S8 family serine peptidase [Bacteroidales bacterium]